MTGVYVCLLVLMIVCLVLALWVSDLARIIEELERKKK
jgi:hypothetical protein